METVVEKSQPATEPLTQEIKEEIEKASGAAYRKAGDSLGIDPDTIFYRRKCEQVSELLRQELSVNHPDVRLALQAEG